MDKLDLLAPETANTENWVIKSKEEADWALQKIADARKEMQENTDYVQAQVEKLQAWLNKVNQTHESTVVFFENKLAPYVEEQIRSSKKKSISLPNGRVGFRKKSVTAKNNDVLMEYVKKNYGEYVKQVEQLDLAGFKKSCNIISGHLITADGEVVPGYEITETNEIYTETI